MSEPPESRNEAAVVRATDESLVASVRHFLSRRLIQRVISSRELAKVFLDSQSWPGYDRACGTWHDAYWKWTEEQFPADDRARLEAVQGDWEKYPVADAITWIKTKGDPELPANERDQQRWVDELVRQEVMQKLSVFLLMMRGPEAEDPETYSLFAPDIFVGSGIGITSYSVLLALQKQRKPTRDKGDRRLKPQLLVYWIPGCLWAFTTDGVAQFLNTLHPRSNNKLYHSKTISDARRDLKLFHSAQPLWWGLAGNPLSLQPLR